MKPVYVCLFAIVVLVSCKAIPPIIETSNSVAKNNSPKDLVIFIDGTSYTPEDNSNINKLKSALQQRDDIATFYTVGVGAGPDSKTAGQIFGVGMSVDVQNAYRFICENYKKNNNDRISMFGFSRGAYSCKVVANLVHVAGVLDFESISDEKLQRRLVRKIYKAYLSKKTIEERKQDVDDVINKWQSKHDVVIRRKSNVNIEVLGLFDTVESLGAPDKTYNPCCPNDNHLEQFCNVNNVFHAVSIDDNRARIFTPVLATCPCIETNCTQQKDINDFVTEVYFSGAHSDVGGGYKVNGIHEDKLSYIPLKWMLKSLEKFNLFTDNTRITDENIYAKIHDAQKDYGIAFLRRNRRLSYFLEQNENYNNGKLKIHESVIKRLANGYIPRFKQHEEKKDQKAGIIKKDWFEKEPFKKCFEKKDSTFIFKAPCETIEIVH